LFSTLAPILPGGYIWERIADTYEDCSACGLSNNAS
jgi:hypothetical protein